LSDQNVPLSAITTSPEQAAAVVATVEYQAVVDRYGELQRQYEAVSVELVALRASSEVARAQLIQPYAWSVLHFLCAYGLVVGTLLFFQGFGWWEFHINDGVMGVVVGSTAVAAIGLVHTVVKGLFPANS
jgi:hypothetical protein